MINLPRWSIRRQTMLLGALPTTFLFIALFGWFVQQRLHDLDRTLASQGELVARHAAAISEFALITGDTNLMSTQLQPLLSDNVSYIALFDEHDALLVSTERPGVGEQREVLLFNIPVVQPAITPRGQPITLGYVSVAMAREPWVQQQRYILWGSAAIGGLALAMAVLLAFLIGRDLTGPLSAITRAVAQLRQGRLDTRVTLSHPGEVGQLQEGINTLARRMQADHKALARQLAELEEARREAEAASRAKSEFLATMSHELRTPMNGALGVLELMQDTPLTPQQQDYLKIASDCTQHLLSVVSDILDFSRIERGLLQLHPDWCSLRDILSQCIAGMRQEAQHKGLALVLDIAPDCATCEVQLDESRLRQILINLLGNAVKFTHQGEVRVTVGGQLAPDGQLALQIDVTDTGVGIPDAQQPHVFEAFRQVDSQLGRRFGGAGLGLAIVQHLSEAMGGRVTLSSREGLGSTFTLQLQVPSRPGSAAPAQPQAAPAARHSGHILVVEDNAVNQLVITAMLESAGYEVITASNGFDALQVLEERHADLVLMDCQMPGMDGLETTRRIRQGEQYRRDIPIVALTANATEEDRLNCLQAGMDDYLSKPVRRQRLTELIDQYLRKQA